MVCFRVDGASPTTVRAIKSMLQERFYVPVMRTIDNSAPPVIGEPFSPTQPPVRSMQFYPFIYVKNVAKTFVFLVLDKNNGSSKSRNGN